MLSIQNLSFRYPGASFLFQGLSLDLKCGSICGLLGRNGAGKTTLLKLLCGLLKAQDGHVLWNNKNVFARQPEVLSDIFFVPESAILPDLPVTLFGTLCGRLYPGFSQQTYISALQSLEVPTTQRIGKLSFGQRRKVNVAFGLASGARLLILDEPTNGFDIPGQTSLRQTLIAFHNDARSIIISTHHIPEFDTILDRLIILEGGRVLLNNALEELQGQEESLNLEALFNQTINKSIQK